MAEQTEIHGATGAPRTTRFSYVATSTIQAKEEAFDDAGTLIARKTFGHDVSGQPLELTSLRGGTSKSYDYSYDPHGSVSLLVGGTGNAEASYGYRAYGEIDDQLSMGDADARDPINPIRYSGKRFDSGSKTLEMGVRRFEPADARFFQQDQLEAAQAELRLASDTANQNRYALAGGNPVNFDDEDGHASQPITVQSLYGGKKPRFHFFRIPFLFEHGVVRGGFFIKRCRALLLLAGDCRDFDPPRVAAEVPRVLPG